MLCFSQYGGSKQLSGTLQRVKDHFGQRVKGRAKLVVRRKSPDAFMQLGNVATLGQIDGEPLNQLTNESLTSTRETVIAHGCGHQS